MWVESGAYVQVTGQSLLGQFGKKAAEFARTLAGVLGRPAILPMPGFAVKAVFGEMGEELLLSRQKVEPGKLISSGYPFRRRELKESLQHLLKS